MSISCLLSSFLCFNFQLPSIHSTGQTTIHHCLLFSSSLYEKVNSPVLCLDNCYLCPSVKDILSEGETSMLPDLLSTVKDPVWLEGKQPSGHSYTVHSAVLFSQQQSNLTLVILGRHLCLGNTSCTV